MAQLLPLVRAAHAEAGLSFDEDGLRDTLGPLLDGIPHGAAWLMGPRRAPVGYVVVSFGYSVEYGGMDGAVDEIYVRAALRRRGIASEALAALMPSLAEHGIKAMHLELGADGAASSAYRRLGFVARDRSHLLSAKLG